MKILGCYKNGNYNVSIYEDGTKVRFSKGTEKFKPVFPESIDMKISNRCGRACQFCHESSTPDGKLAYLLPLGSILQSIRPYTELALGGGNVFEHPDLIPFLTKMRDRKVICNLTVHLQDFLSYYNLIGTLIESDLVHGVGVSVNGFISDTDIERLQAYKDNVVIHVIAGVVPMSTLEALSYKGFKLLILGYKIYGRGKDYFAKNIAMNIKELAESLESLQYNFPIISFDNLAIQQMQVYNIVSKEYWDRCYMGDDGQFTMYIDLVENTYAKSSTSERIPITDLTIDTLFRKVRNDCNDA